MSARPGQWLGVLGGGQLGRMFCQSAQALGFRVLVLDPDRESPAGDVADDHLVAGYDDQSALRDMARRCEALTTEFENVPAESLAFLAQERPVAPAARAVQVAQDRVAEKAFIRSLGVAVAPYVQVRCLKDIDDAPDALFAGILKAARLGYDGKGQHRVTHRDQARLAFESMGQVPCVLEAHLPLHQELSVILARDVNGHCAVFPVARNVHHNGILAVSHVDTQHTQLTGQATDAAVRIATGLDYHGVLCVEFFVLTDGSLVVNEMAPRPHNSGHYTQNACVTSQFEQQVRAMAGLPLGDTRLLAPAVMLNILGDAWFGAQGSESCEPCEPDWAAILALPGVSLHLYGKRQPRLGRKMGHVNVTAPTLPAAVEMANQVVKVLRLPIQATSA